MWCQVFHNRNFLKCSTLPIVLSRLTSVYIWIEQRRFKLQSSVFWRMWIWHPNTLTLWSIRLPLNNWTKTLNEIIDLAAKVDQLNGTYQNVLSEINMTNAQINSVIDTLYCFQNLTSCRVNSLKSTFVKTIRRYFLATTRPVLRCAV